MASGDDDGKRCVLQEPFGVSWGVCALAFCQVWVRLQLVSALGEHLTFIVFTLPAGRQWQARFSTRARTTATTQDAMERE
jgi:hypothetical protein